MEIIHKNVILADKVKYYDNIFNKGRGLRFSRRLSDGEALILAGDTESRIDTAIDMLFVFFPIDVLWLNKNKKVVDVRTNIKPFTPLAVPKEAAMYVIEMPYGMARGIRIGDKISFDISE